MVKHGLETDKMRQRRRPRRPRRGPGGAQGAPRGSESTLKAPGGGVNLDPGGPDGGPDGGPHPPSPWNPFLDHVHVWDLVEDLAFRTWSGPWSG